MTDQRRQLRTTFNSAAKLYHQARPNYPPELYNELVRTTALQPRDRMLEIGCAAGKATLPLAHRGFPITCVEIGPALAVEARHNLTPFPGVHVIEADFDTWQTQQNNTLNVIQRVLPAESIEFEGCDDPDDDGKFRESSSIACGHDFPVFYVG